MVAWLIAGSSAGTSLAMTPGTTSACGCSTDIARTDHETANPMSAAVNVTASRG